MSVEIDSITFNAPGNVKIVKISGNGESLPLNQEADIHLETIKVGQSLKSRIFNSSPVKAIEICGPNTVRITTHNAVYLSALI